MTISFIKIDINNPQEILEIGNKPILSPGNLGAFDSFGVMPSYIVNYLDKKYLYYIGWFRGENIPFRWAIGLAISDDGGLTYKKFSEVPILDRNHIDPYMVTSPTVIIENNVWKMWYSSSTKCEYIGEKLHAPYHIRYAISHDGINWERNGHVCIDFKNKTESGIGRGNVIKENGIYKMWYSFFTDTYRIGYAESNDGLEWIRKDNEAGISLSESGWDSEMINHSFVFTHNDVLYMLYAGNGYGKSGFGYAIAE